MRLFIAIPIPDPVSLQLAGLRQPLEGVRWQPEKQMHLTLKFLGEASGERFQQLLPRLKEVEAGAFSIDLQGIGYFPQGRDPKVLWAGVQENQALLRLQQKVEQACNALGFKPEKRRYKPHVTIGRVKGGSKKDVMSFINQHKQFEAPGVPVDSFVLYESKLHPEGPRHYRRKEYQLQSARQE